MQKVIFLDESGTTNMRVESFDKFYPVFVVGGVLFEQGEYEKFDREFREFKKKYLDSDEFVVHNAEIRRPSKFGNPWLLEKFTDVGWRRRFYYDLENLIREMEFKLICCGIRKWDWRESGHGFENEDVYLLCLRQVLQRCLGYIGKGEKISIYPEKITRKEEHADIEASIWEMSLWGEDKFDQVRTVSKKENMSGHQLIDVVLGAVGRKILGKSISANFNGVAWPVIAEKLAEEDLIVYPEV